MMCYGNYLYARYLLFYIGGRETMVGRRQTGFQQTMLKKYTTMKKQTASLLDHCKRVPQTSQDVEQVGFFRKHFISKYMFNPLIHFFYVMSVIVVNHGLAAFIMVNCGTLFIRMICGRISIGIFFFQNVSHPTEAFMSYDFFHKTAGVKISLQILKTN